MIQRIRGTNDVLGDDAQAYAALEATARRILERAGYGRIETPTFEATELFARGVGASTDIVQKEMYTLPEDGITLRPEGTAPVCRAYLEHGMHKLPQPVKLWYLSSFFRHERAQAGRYRQFWQVGAEALGSADPAVDAESIVLLARLLEEMGVSAVRLRLSSLGGPAARAEYRERLQGYLREHQAGLSEEVRARIELNPLRAFDSDHEGTKRVMAGAPRLSEHLSDADAEHFAEVCELLGVANVAYELDWTLVRGLDYYTRTVFEFASEALGAQSGVGGGGRYDGLVETLGGPPAPGMGWAAGVERILLAGAPERAGAATTGASRPPAASPLELFVALEEPGAEAPPGDGSSTRPRDDGQRRSAGPAGIRANRRAAFALLGEARAAGLTAQMELAGRSLKGQLGLANSLGARYVAIVADGQTTLRDMQEGGQQQIATDTVVHAVLQGLRTL